MSAANIRSGPDVSERRLGHAFQGTIVEKVAATGDWLEIRTWRGQAGFIHADLLEKY